MAKERDAMGRREHPVLIEQSAPTEVHALALMLHPEAHLAHAVRPWEHGSSARVDGLHSLTYPQEMANPPPVGRNFI